LLDLRGARVDAGFDGFFLPEQSEEVLDLAAVDCTPGSEFSVSCFMRGQICYDGVFGP